MTSKPTPDLADWAYFLFGFNREPLNSKFRLLATLKAKIVKTSKLSNFEKKQDFY